MPTETQQRVPERGEPALERGVQYRMYALKDVGLPLTNCIFTYGEAFSPAQTPDDGDSGESAGSADGCRDGEGFGSECLSDADCRCAEAPFCATMPGQSQGLCTATEAWRTPTFVPMPGRASI